jgi:hypothetical protein
MTDRHQPQQQDSYLRHLENEAKLKAWKQQKKAEAEQKEREQKQARLHSYLHRLEREWIDHTGTNAPYDLREQWKREYVAGVAAEQELERELRLAEAAKLYPGEA